MKKILNKWISKIKGEEYKLNEHLTTIYILHICLIRFMELLRGGVRLHKIPIFLGRRVTIIGKSYLNIGKGTTIEDNVVIDAFSENGINFGSNVKIGANTIVNGSGSLKISGKGMDIGDNSSVGEYSYFGCAGGIEIGKDVIMGQNIRFHAQNHNFQSLEIPIKDQGTYQSGIKINDNCWIGAGVTFLDGITVGSGCVIGANTLVNKSIPDNSVAVGSPVRIIKKRGN